MITPLDPHLVAAGTDTASAASQVEARQPLMTRILGAGSRMMAHIEAAAGDGRRTCNFLRERRLFRGRPDDVFVASYPRSGTTWAQFAVYLLVGNRDLDFTHIGQVAPWYERSLAVSSARADDFNRMMGPRVFKSHLTPEWLPRTGRRIYVWRDGRDVAVSYFHLYRSHLGFTGDFADFFQRFLRGDVQYRGWAAHVRRWQDHAQSTGQSPTLLLRYEDMQADPGSTLDRMANFLGVTLSDERRREILDLTSFKSMKTRQEQFDHATSVLLERGMMRNQFIREGRVGQGESTLDPSGQHALEEAFVHTRPPARQWRLADFLH